MTVALMPLLEKALTSPGFWTSASSAPDSSDVDVMYRSRSRRFLRSALFCTHNQTRDPHTCWSTSMPECGRHQRGIIISTPADDDVLAPLGTSIHLCSLFKALLLGFLIQLPKVMP